ncbi:MAG: hypothetical protein M3245_02960 [Actinomycetota bacterium]|nr:hypothetical protein [Actinomycetota bacterium]
MGRALGGIIVLVGMAGAGLAGYRLAEPTILSAGGGPPFPRSEPAPGDPPLVLISVTDESL